MKFSTWARNSFLSFFVGIVLSSPVIAETRSLNGVSGAYCESMPDNVIIKELAVQWVFGYLSAMSTLEEASYGHNLTQGLG